MNFQKISQKALDKMDFPKIPLKAQDKMDFKKIPQKALDKMDLFLIVAKQPVTFSSPITQSPHLHIPQQLLRQQLPCS